MIRNFAGLVGLVALLAATVIGMLVVAGFIGDAPERGPQFINVREEQKEVKVQTLERTLKTGDISWTVHDAKLTNKISAYTLPPETRSGVFVEISFTVENTNSEMPVTLDKESVELVRDNISSPAHADENSQFVSPDLNILFNENGLIPPGESKEGKVYFDLGVPFGIEEMKEATGLEATFKDTDPTKVNEESIKLEF